MQKWQTQLNKKVLDRFACFGVKTKIIETLILNIDDTISMEKINFFLLKNYKILSSVPKNGKIEEIVRGKKQFFFC